MSKAQTFIQLCENPEYDRVSQMVTVSRSRVADCEKAISELEAKLSKELDPERRSHLQDRLKSKKERLADAKAAMQLHQSQLSKVSH